MKKAKPWKVAPAPSTTPAPDPPALAYDRGGSITTIMRDGGASKVVDVVVITEKPRVPAVWVSAHYTLGKAWRELPAETPVIVVRDNGSVLETWTLRTPRELGGQPVVDCEGISGPYHLRCVYLRAKR